MELTRNIMKFLKDVSLYILTLCIILGYGVAVYSLKRKGALSENDFINNITIFVGWIVALLIAWIYLQKTRKDNQIAKKDEIRKSLEIDAFREINEAVTTFSSIITSVSTAYLFTWPYKLKSHMQNPRMFEFNKTEIDLEINQQIVNLLGGSADFILAIEANEIAVIQFDHLRKYIQFKIDDVNKLIRDFQKNLASMGIEDLRTEKNYSEFKRKCKDLHDELGVLQSYLFDYRIELMNSMLGEIFDSHVLVRRPRDPKYKILTEVAIKEEVEKEAKAREDKFLKEKKYK